MIDLTFIGHSAFFIETQVGSNILIDPFISSNPLANFDVNKVDIEHIFLTHGHSDHFGDTIDSALSKNSTVTAIFELANYIAKSKIKTIPVNLGGSIEYDFGKVVFLNAMHSSSSIDGKYLGCPASILFEFNDCEDSHNITKIFHCGDSCLISEFELIGELYKPDVALLPIGSRFTMDIEQASIAAKMLKVKTVIPMHYNTFDFIKVNVSKFKKIIETQGQNCLVMNPNDKIRL